MIRSLGYICSLLALLLCSCHAQEPASSPSEPENAHKQRIWSSTLQEVRNLPAEYLIGPYIPASGPLHPLNKVQRLDVYYHQTFLTAGAYMLRMFAAGLDQARDSPSQWGGGMEGFGKRFGSRYGVFVISNTFQTLGNAALGYESRYDLCRCSGFWPRTRHAIARNFVTYNRTERELRPAIPLYVGSLGAGMISSAWLPGPRDEWKQGGIAALEQAGFGSVYNVASEFAIDIMRKITGNKYPHNLNRNAGFNKP